MPLLARGEPVGILNAFFAPGQVVGDTELEFLLAMAEQAAMAVDNAALLERERDVARREERQKLARDLHDSVVQQVFSMMMQARSLGVLVERGLPPAPDKVAQVADDLSSSAEDVLADLRGMVVELRPAATTAGGLASALRSLVDTTSARTDMDVSLDIDDPAELSALEADLLEDVYRILAEALHNSVKHADAASISVRLAMTSHGRRRRLVAEVTDDGRGMNAETGGAGARGSASSGFGMTVMRERAARWGGAVRVRQPAGGWDVRAVEPAPADLAARDAGDRDGGRAVTAPDPIRVLVVDDHAVVRRGVVAYLEALEDVDVSGEAGDGQEALDQLARASAHGELPDVVLMDLQMPGMDGVTATGEVLRRFPQLKVVILTSFGETERVHAALESGASGYLLKDAGPAEVDAALRAAVRDEVFLDAAVTRRLTQEMRAPRTGLGVLTAREKEVLILIAEGRSNKDIARHLVISERTARTHVSHLLTKMGLTSRTQAALLAVKEGLVQPR